MPIVGELYIEKLKLDGIDPYMARSCGFSFYYKGKHFLCAEGQGDGTNCTMTCNMTLASLAAYSKEHMSNDFAIFLCLAETTKTKRRKRFYQLLDTLKTDTAVMILIDDIKRCEPVVELLKFTKDNPFNVVE